MAITAAEYERIKTKIQKAKETGARTRGALERVNTQLEKTHNIHSREEGIEILDDIDKKIKIKQEKKDSLVDKLENAVDWDSI